MKQSWVWQAIRVWASVALVVLGVFFIDFSADAWRPYPFIGLLLTFVASGSFILSALVWVEMGQAIREDSFRSIR